MKCDGDEPLTPQQEKSSLMIHIDRKSIIKTSIAVLLIAFTMFIRSPIADRYPVFKLLNKTLLSATIYFGLFIAWGVSLRRRIIQKQVLQLLLSIVGLMLLWFLLRTMRYLDITDNLAVDRWLWYAYYIPMLLIPLANIFVALSLGKLEDYNLPRWLPLISLPTIFLMIMVLTNDLHLLVFKFPQGMDRTSANYQYGVLYWFVLTWMILPIFVSIVAIISKSRVPRSRKILYLPFVPYLGGLIYGILYVLGVPFLRVIAGDMTAIFCLFTMGIFESLIHSGLIRSNTHYEELFHQSNIKAKITDNEGNVCYEVALATAPSNRDMRTSTLPIHGGKITWLEDISEIRGLISSLDEINKELAKENSLLQAELELKEREIKLEEKLRLNNKITQKTEPKLRALENILSQEGDIAPCGRQQLVKICVLGTYVKRLANLLILKEERDIFSIRELEYSLMESVEALTQGGVLASLRARVSGEIAADDAMLLYDAFEEIVEAALPTLGALYVNFYAKDKAVRLKLQMDGENLPQGSAFAREAFTELEKREARIKTDREENTLAIGIELWR